MTEKRIDVVVRTGNSKDEVKDLDAAMKGLGASADKAGKELNDLSNGAKGAGNNLPKLKPAAEGVKNGIAGVGRAAGQAGIQVQQFVGQVQGGQNAMLALSAQATDLGIVLGAPLAGVVVGLGAALAGSLAPSLFNAKSGIEAYIEVAEKLDSVVAKNKSGVTLLSEELIELAQVSNSLARAKIAQALIDAEKAIEASASGVKEVIEDLPRAIFINVKKISESFEATGGSVDEFGDKLKNLNVKGVPIGRIADLKQGLAALERVFGLNTEQASRLAIAMGDVRREASQFNVQKLITTVEELGEETDHTSEGLIKFTNDLLPLIQGSADATDKINALKASMIDLPTAIQDSKDGAGIAAPSGDDAAQDAQLDLENAQMTMDQEYIQRQAHFERMDQLEQAANDRKAMQALFTAKRIENANKMVDNSYMNSANIALGAMLQIMGGNEKAVKTIKLIQGGMAAYTVWSNHQAAAATLLLPPPLGLGPIYGAAPAAAMALAGKVNAAAVLAGAAASTFAGGGGSTAITAGSTPSQSQSQSPAQSPQDFNQVRAIDIRLDDDAVLTGSAVKQLITSVLSSDEDVTLQITANQSQLQREGAI